MPPRLESVIEDYIKRLEDDWTSVGPKEIIKVTALAAWNAALDAVREAPDLQGKFVKYLEPTTEKLKLHNAKCDGHEACRTAVTDHINSLGV